MGQAPFPMGGLHHQYVRVCVFHKDGQPKKRTEPGYHLLAGLRFTALEQQPGLDLRDIELAGSVSGFRAFSQPRYPLIDKGCGQHTRIVTYSVPT
jgi:hypothetical protein